MSFITDAFLENLLKEGMPVVIIPEGFLKKKKKNLEDDFHEGLRNSINLNKTTTVMPSPVPG